VNSGQAVSTPAVFKTLESRDNPGMEMPERWGDRAVFLSWLSAQRNDLEAAAIAVEPGIAAVLTALRNTPAVRLARMSGSGGTCFGLYDTLEDALGAARVLQAARPDWWSVASPL